MTSRLASTTLRIGDPAPPIALPGLDGELVELEEARGVCGVLLLFAPGAWSPATRRQVGEINAVYEQFRENGIQVVVLITQNAAPLQDRLSSFAIPFPILADEHRHVARDYGVFRAVSLDGFGVTRPAAFIVDKEGVVRFAYIGKADDDVPEVDALLRLSIWLVGSTPIEEQEDVDAFAPEEEESIPAGEQLVLISDEVLEGELVDNNEPVEAVSETDPVDPDMETTVLAAITADEESAAQNDHAELEEPAEAAQHTNGHHNGELAATTGELDHGSGDSEEELTLASSSERKPNERHEP